MNSTYLDCKDELVFANLSAHECGREKAPKPPGSTRLRNCESRFTAKNNSFNNLQDRYQTQSKELGNVSAELRTCRRSLSEIEGEFSKEKGLASRLQEEVRVLEEKATEQRQDTNRRVQGLRSVVLGLQRHLLCLPSEENCSQEAEMYTCIPSFIAEYLCLLAAVEGQELFALEVCPLIGDSTWSPLDLPAFIRTNPRSSAVLILIVILAFIGGLTVLAILFWTLFYYRSRIMFNLGYCFGFLRMICQRANSVRTDENEMKERGKEGDVEQGVNDQAASVKPPLAAGRSATPPIDKKGLDKAWENEGMKKNEEEKGDQVESEKKKAPLAPEEDTSNV